MFRLGSGVRCAALALICMAASPAAAATITMTMSGMARGYDSGGFNGPGFDVYAPFELTVVKRTPPVGTPLVDQVYGSLLEVDFTLDGQLQPSFDPYSPFYFADANQGDHVWAGDMVFDPYLFRVAFERTNLQQYPNLRLHESAFLEVDFSALLIPIQIIDGNPFAEKTFDLADISENYFSLPKVRYSYGFYYTDKIYGYSAYYEVELLPTHVSVVTTDIAATAPEPSAWALMIAGFGLAGVSMRRRARGAVAAG